MPAFIFALLLFAGLSVPTQARSQDKARGASLDAYLKKLGYEGLDLTRVPKSHLGIAGIIGDKQKASFIVDTGWTITSLDRGSAKKLKTLEQLNAVFEEKRVAALPRTNVVLIDRLKLGSVQLLNQPAQLTDLSMDYVHTGFQGVLGVDFLSRNHCIIDVGGRRLYLKAAAPTPE
jgi:predicted aspartyl protease